MKVAVASGITHWIIVYHEAKDKESAPACLWLDCSFSRRQHFTWNRFCCGWFQQGISISSSTLVKAHHRSSCNGSLVFCLHAFCKPAVTFFNYFPYLLWNSLFYVPPNMQVIFLQKQIRKLNKTQSLQDLFHLYILHKPFSLTRCLS